MITNLITTAGISKKECEKTFLLICLLTFSTASFSQAIKGRSKSDNKTTVVKSDSVANKQDSIAANNQGGVAERDKLFYLNFISGTIYFSGGSYKNVEAVTVGKNGNAQLKKVAERAVPGVTVIYDNVFYKNDKNKMTGPINKTVTL